MSDVPWIGSSTSGFLDAFLRARIIINKLSVAQFISNNFPKTLIIRIFATFDIQECLWLGMSATSGFLDAFVRAEMIMRTIRLSLSLPIIICGDMGKIRISATSDIQDSLGSDVRAISVYSRITSRERSPSSCPLEDYCRKVAEDQRSSRPKAYRAVRYTQRAFFERRVNVQCVPVQGVRSGNISRCERSRVRKRDRARSAAEVERLPSARPHLRGIAAVSSAKPLELSANFRRLGVARAWMTFGITTSQ